VLAIGGDGNEEEWPTVEKGEASIANVEGVQSVRAILSESTERL
jgi:hypothetical protein